MVIQHNLTAMNAGRMLGVTTGQQAKQSEKLASGYRINRAADDAAGLTISEKMRKQIRGLSQASTNAQDGVSAVQTAEGALTEVHSMLQRMNELAVQSANGTNSETDRQAIQDEIKELKTEIDRVAETTKFNETYLLKGDKTADAEYAITYAEPKATILTGGTLYKEDGTAFTTADELTAAFAEDPETKVYTYAPGTGLQTTSGGGDYEYTAAVAVEATANNTALYQAGNNSLVANGADAAAFLNPSTTVGGNATVKADIYKDSTAYGTLSGGTSDPAQAVSNTELTFWRASDGKIFTIAQGSALVDDQGAAMTNGTTTAAAGYKLVTDAVASDFTITKQGAPATATITNSVYDRDGNEYAVGDEDKLLAYINEKGSTAPLYSTNFKTGVEATKNTDYMLEGGKKLYDADGNAIAANGLSNYFETADGITVTQKEGTSVYDAEGNRLNMDEAKIEEYLGAPERLVGKLTLKLHVGADATANNQITLDINAMSTKALGIDKLKVDGKDDTNALAAIDTIKQAIQKVSTQRSTLGAVQNRLEHTIANLDNVVENTTAAESRIRDTDMAAAMVEYSKNNILAQAGQSMLAQANQSTQGVLSLLQ